MRTPFRAATFLGATLAVFWPPSPSQQHHEHPAPEKFGEVSFPISCSPESQGPFNQGVALLHSFAYSAAEKTFRKIGEADPKCAMAHWGVAMSYYHQLWEPPIASAESQRGQMEIRRARVIGGPSAREQSFIDALALIYKDASRVPYATRALAYEKAMGSAASRYPTDPESQIFYALALLVTASPMDRNHTNQKRAAEILEPIYKQYPQHPGIAHYLIHAYDSPGLAICGLPAARAYAQIAPSAPHALHMPSHIFTHLGLWEDSVHSNIAAREAAHAQGDIGEELHAMDFLMYAYLQQGRNAEALRLLQELRAMPDLPVGQFKVGYAATAMPIRYAVERGEWAEAAAIPPNAGTQPQVSAMTYWCHAIALARNHKPSDATPELQRLNQALLEVRREHDAYWAEQLQIQLKEAEGWIALARGQQTTAVSLLRAAAETEDNLEKRPVTPGPIVPAREQLGDLLLGLNRASNALREFEVSLKNAPGRRGALIGAARAARMTGDSTKANQFEQELRALTPESTP
jgi:tetratricopeptide (TPR) repeat protein